MIHTMSETKSSCLTLVLDTIISTRSMVKNITLFTTVRFSTLNIPQKETENLTWDFQKMKSRLLFEGGSVNHMMVSWAIHFWSIVNWIIEFYVSFHAPIDKLDSNWIRVRIQRTTSIIYIILIVSNNYKFLEKIVKGFEYDKGTVWNAPPPRFSISYLSIVIPFDFKNSFLTLKYCDLWLIFCD